MENRWRAPGIAEVTLHAYARRHGNSEETACERCRARIKPICLTIVCVSIVSLAIYWLIVGPIFESLNSDGSVNSGRTRDCSR